MRFSYHSHENLAMITRTRGRKRCDSLADPAAAKRQRPTVFSRFNGVKRNYIIVKRFGRGRAGNSVRKDPLPPPYPVGITRCTRDYLLACAPIHTYMRVFLRVKPREVLKNKSVIFFYFSLSIHSFFFIPRERFTISRILRIGVEI